MLPLVTRSAVCSTISDELAPCTVHPAKPTNTDAVQNDFLIDSPNSLRAKAHSRLRTVESRTAPKTQPRGLPAPSARNVLQLECQRSDGGVTHQRRAISKGEPEQPTSTRCANCSDLPHIQDEGRLRRPTNISPKLARETSNLVDALTYVMSKAFALDVHRAAHDAQFVVGAIYSGGCETQAAAAACHNGSHVGAVAPSARPVRRLDRSD